MIVKKSARGLIRYEEAAKNFTSVLYPKLIEVRSKYKKQISELRKNHKLLGIKYNFISPEKQKKEEKIAFAYLMSIFERVYIFYVENGKNCDLGKETYSRDYIKGHWDWEVFTNIGKQSKEEIELVEYIKTIYSKEIQTSIRGLIPKKEIDILKFILKKLL